MTYEPKPADLTGTLETKDQNTGRTITWKFEAFKMSLGGGLQHKDGSAKWTHFVGLQRPKGKATYTMWAVIEDGKIVKHQTLRKAF